MQLRRRTWGNYLAQGLEPTKLVVPKLLSAVCCLLLLLLLLLLLFDLLFAHVMATEMHGKAMVSGQLDKHSRFTIRTGTTGTTGRLGL